MIIGRIVIVIIMIRIIIIIIIHAGLAAHDGVALDGDGASCGGFCRP